MSKINRSPRTFRIIRRMTTIVRPEIKTANHRSGTSQDYVDVPVQTTHGTWPVLQLLSDDSMVRLAVHARKLGVI